MASKFLTNIDLNQNQLVNATFEVLGTAPDSGLFEGRMYYNSTFDTIQVYSGSAWRTFVNSITKGGDYTDAITLGESNGTVTITLNLADVDSAGLLSSTFWGLLNGATSNATVSTLVQRDSSGNIKVATPTDAAHAATKGYVDSARQGLDVKQSVRAATTGPVTLATDLEAGDTLDTTVTLVAGNRILVKDQATASQNGIYIVQATGAPVRATDANGTADTGEVSGGTFVFVEEGTLNADSGFVVSSNGPIAVGTDPMNWVQFSGAGAITAGDGLTQNGTTINAVGTTDRIAVSANAIDISTNYVGQASITTLGTITTGTWNGVDIAVTDGGTGASTAADARTNLGVKTTSGAVTTSTSVLARTAHQACAASSGTTSVTTVTHNFNTKNVIVQVYQVSNGETVTTDVARTTVDSVTVTINGSTIASDDYHIVVTG
jgi:hypothetical protein